MYLNEDESWQRHAKRGTPLADFECRHGWLPWEDCKECGEGLRDAKGPSMKPEPLTRAAAIGKL